MKELFYFGNVRFKIILVALLVKIIYYLFAILVSNYSSKFPSIALYTFKNDSVPGLLKIFKIHDAGWYELIAVNGHHKISTSDLKPSEANKWQQSYYAFFPLYPLITGTSLQITNWHYFTVAFFWSLIFSITCFLVFFEFAKIYFGDEYVAFYSTLCLIVFPFNFYFSMFMTEALFVLLLLLAFLSIKKGNWIVFSISGSLLALTRPNGIYMVIPLIIYFFESNEWKISKKKLVFVTLALLVIASTFAAYCIYLQHMTGDYFAFATAQKGWNKKFSIIPFTTLFSSGEWRQQVLSIYTVLFMFFAAISVKRFPFSFHVLIWICLLLPLMAGSVQSMPRYISAIFPFSLLLGKYISNYRLRNIVVLILLAGQLWSFYFWITEDPLAY